MKIETGNNGREFLALQERKLIKVLNWHSSVPRKYFLGQKTISIAKIPSIMFLFLSTELGCLWREHASKWSWRWKLLVPGDLGRCGLVWPADKGREATLPKHLQRRRSPRTNLGNNER